MTLVFSILLACSLSLIGCRELPVPAEQQIQIQRPTPIKAEYRKLSAREARAQLEKDPTIRLVDVRTPEEYRERRIAGSILIPDYDLETQALRLLPDKDEKIFLYCRSGRRSYGAAMKLVNMGYTNVYDFGGIIDWPFETVSGEE